MRNPLHSLLGNQLANIQENLTKALDELEDVVVEGSSGGGAVKVRMTGSGKVLDVEITPAAVSEEDIELLQDLVCAAMRDALAKVSERKKQTLMDATPLGALGIDDVPDLF